MLQMMCVLQMALRFPHKKTSAQTADMRMIAAAKKEKCRGKKNSNTQRIEILLVA